MIVIMFCGLKILDGTTLTHMRFVGEFTYIYLTKTTQM